MAQIKPLLFGLTCHEEHGYLLLAVSVLPVQLVHVGALQPVREQGQQVGRQVNALQTTQLGPVSLILLCLLTVTLILINVRPMLWVFKEH